MGILEKGWWIPFDETYMDLIFEFDNHGTLTRYYTFGNIDGYSGPGSSSARQKACRFDCIDAEKACIDSINEGEDTPKGTLRCEKEKQMCFQQCEANASLHGDCDPGMESCD